MLRRRSLALASTAALTLVGMAACGPDSPSAEPPHSSTPPSAAADDRGWLDGAPQWYVESGDDDGDGAVMASADAATAEMSRPAPAGGADSAGAPVAPDSPQGGLRAGSVDDNADFEGYLEYLARVAELGVPLRPFDPTGRIVVTVTGSDGRPVAGAAVQFGVAEPNPSIAERVTLRTTADGTVRFHPTLYGRSVGATYETWIDNGPSTTVAAGETAQLTIEEPGGRVAPIAIDVMFLLDATGSMGDEISRLKTQIDSVADRVAALQGAPDVRFGMTLYRDEGDSFVTATRDFTSDVAAFRADLADVVADGGGDYPEALEEGLAEALQAPAWRDPATTLQLVFLVADAPPQVARQVDQPYTDSLRDAIGRGLKIFPVASSESDDQAEAVFRQLAQGTGARFVFLTYGAAGAATGPSTDIASTDYEELALDDLVVRLVAEELAALTGDTDVVPPVTAPPVPTTNPPGQ